MESFPCPKCAGVANPADDRPFPDVHPAGGERQYWECDSCLTTFTTRRYLEPGSTVVGERYEPGIVEASATFDARLKTV